MLMTKDPPIGQTPTALQKTLVDYNSVTDSTMVKTVMSRTAGKISSKSGGGARADRSEDFNSLRQVQRYTQDQALANFTNQEVKAGKNIQQQLNTTNGSAA